jgi:hypothetical protein
LAEEQRSEEPESEQMLAVEQRSEEPESEQMLVVEQRSEEPESEQLEAKKVNLKYYNLNFLFKQLQQIKIIILF